MLDLGQIWKKQKNKSNYIRWVSWIPVLVVMIVIYIHSAKPAEVSDSSSTPIAQALIRIYDLTLGVEEKESYPQRLSVANFLVRKAAHIIEYTILSLCMAWPLWIRKLRGRRFMMLNFLTCLAYAASDEFHQLYVEGRSGNLRDIGIDAIGCLLGTLIFCLLIHKIKKRKPY